MLARSGSAFNKWLLFVCVWLTLGCHPKTKGLGDSPPKIDENTQTLAVFDPAALSGPAATGIDLDTSQAGPPQPPEPPPLPAPAVVDYGPTGESSQYPTIQIRFNRPMVAFGEKQRVSAEEAGFRFDPPIPGEAYWAEPTRLVFEPSDAVDLATQYGVAVVRKIAAVDGPEIDVDLHFEFATQAPHVSLWTDHAAAMNGVDGYHWKAKVAVETSHEVSLAELRKHVGAKARDGEGKLVPVDLRVTQVKRDPDGYRYPDFWIAPASRWPADSEVIITVDEQLRGKLGPRPIGYPTVHSFRTPAGVEALDRVCVEAEYNDGCELGPVVVRFSAPIRRSQAKYLSIRPKPRGFDTLAVDRDYDEDGRELNAYYSVMLWGDFARGQHYAITVDDRIRDVHGQPLVNEQQFDVEFVEPPASLVLEQAFGTHATALGAKLGIESRHVESLKVRVALLDDATHEELIGEDLHRWGWPSGLKPTKQQTITLKHSGQFGWSSHELDLAQFTGGAPATVLVEVAPKTMLARAQGRLMPSARRGLVQITDLGITAVGSLPGGRVRVARLRDDKPVAGAEVELIHEPGGDRVALGKTDKNGLIELPGATELGEHALVRARKGDDQIVLAIGSLWQGPKPEGKALRLGESIRATVMTERPLYKPGERVRVMGWATVATPYELSGLRALPSKAKIEIELRDSRDEVVAKTTVRAKDHGKFWATLQVPSTAALGHYTVTAKLFESSFAAQLQVKDFPVPAFEVSAEADATDIHGGESTTIRVNASYYFGGRVPITRVRHANDCREVDYRPPGLEPGFEVAPRRDYWRGYGRLGRASVLMAPTASAAQGHVEYDIPLATGHDGQTRQCTHSVAIADISEQEIGAESTIWVHPEFYLAAKTPRLLRHGDRGEVAIETLDFDGSPIAVDDVEVTLTRSWSEPEYVTEDGKKRFAGWRSRKKVLDPCETRSDGVATCSFAKLEHGSYEVLITAKRGRYEPSIRDWMWVSPPPDASWPAAPAQQLSVEVSPAKPVAGQTVHARIRAPWTEGGGVLLLAKGGLHELKTFTLEQGRAEVALEVSDAWIPGAKIHVLAVEPGTPTSTPKLRTDEVEVSVGQDARELEVDVRVQAEAQTRETIPIEIEVRDQLGQPVRGHVSVWAVDEAVLSLAPLVLPDFVGTFVVGFSGALDIVSGYTSLLLPFVARPDPYDPLPFDPNWTSSGLGLFGTGKGGGGSGYGSGSGYGGFGGGGPGMPQSRNKFDSAPIFIADAELDARGIARLEGELPDNLTTFRLTAVASSPLAAGGVEARFGTGDARVRVTRPMVVRAAMPRVMRPGDLAEIGVIVDNLRGGAGTVDVELEIHDGDGIVELIDEPKASASIDAGGQLRLPFRVKAITTGTPEIEVTAVMRPRGASGRSERVGGQVLGDALRLPLPVEPERTLTDRVAVYGSLADDGAALLPFVVPDDADPKFGGMSVSVGSTLLGGVEDAVAYLVHYPYGCVEQTSSSLLPLIPLGRLARDYPLGIDDVDEYVAAGIARLRSMQLQNGGFAYWPGGTEPAPFASGYATWVLGQAAEAGYPVPPKMLTDADRYLLGVIAEWESVTGPSLGEDIEIAMMLSALAERSGAPATALDTLYSRRQRLPVFSQAMLLLALERQARGRADPRIPELLGELKSVVDEREAVAKVEITQRWTWYWDSSPRSSALVLMAMLAADPEHPLVSKLTRGLLEARRGGRWANTQENAYALVALADYAAVYEAEDPRFEGRVWLGNTPLASVHVEGREFAFKDAFTPMAELLTAAEQADERLILERAGQGRMYYRVGLEWASTAADKPAKAEGITLTRTLRGAQGPIADDQPVASGDLLAIDVEIEIPAALDHVAIEIPLPAGLEAVDLELGKGGQAMKLPGWRGNWVSHQELRRDRAVLFADHLQPGVHRSTVFLRATTPGEYVMPAGHAEQMYYPEVYGRTTARRLVVR